MESRIARLLIVVAAGAVACYAVVTTGSMYFGVGVNKGDAVIVKDQTGWTFPATVSGFGESGVKVKVEEPGQHYGMTLNFAYDEVRVVSRQSDEWKRLTQSGRAQSD